MVKRRTSNIQLLRKFIRYFKIPISLGTIPMVTCVAQVGSPNRMLRFNNITTVLVLERSKKFM